MIWRKKRDLKEEKELFRTNLGEVKKHKTKVLRALNNLEKWFAKGDINYLTYLERKEKLSQLKGEYEVYLYQTKKELKNFDKIERKNINRLKFR